MFLIKNSLQSTALSFKKVLSFRKACYFIAGGKSEWEKVIFAFISLIFNKISGIKIWSSGQIFVTL